MFNRFDIIPACDGLTDTRTDRQTDRQTGRQTYILQRQTARYAQHRAVKTPHHHKDRNVMLCLDVKEIGTERLPETARRKRAILTTAAVASGKSSATPSGGLETNYLRASEWRNRDKANTMALFVRCKCHQVSQWRTQHGFYPGFHITGCKQEPGAPHGYTRDLLTYLNAAVYI